MTTSSFFFYLQFARHFIADITQWGRSSVKQQMAPISNKYLYTNIGKKIQVHFNRILTCFVLQNNDALFVDTKYVVDNVLGTQELGIENTV